MQEKVDVLSVVTFSHAVPAGTIHNLYTILLNSFEQKRLKSNGRYQTRFLLTYREMSV